MTLSAFDDLSLSEASVESLDKVAASATDPLNDEVRVELERQTEAWADVVDPVVDLSTL